MPKFRAPLCFTGQDQHFATFPMDRSQVEKGKKVATVSAGLFENFIKIGNKHVLCELILGKTVPAWLRLLPQRQLVFLALDYT